jgi:hypothetical protein
MKLGNYYYYLKLLFDCSNIQYYSFYEIFNFRVY